MEQGILEIFSHLILTLAMLLVVVLIARVVVAGTKYSPTLIIVVFGLPDRTPRTNGKNIYIRARVVASRGLRLYHTAERLRADKLNYISPCPR